MNKNHLLLLLLGFVLFACKKDDENKSNEPPPPVNQDPAAVFEVIPDSGEITTQFHFDATLSHDVEDALDLLSVRWDFENDGAWDTQWSYQKTATHVYSDSGNYIAVLQVRDSDDGLDTASRQVHVFIPDSVGSKFDILAGYLIQNNLDISHVISDWIMDADAVYQKGTDDFHIIDIRQQDDYDAGHIDGAINSSLSNILDAAESATKPILVVCYTGQASAYVLTALRLSGYIDAKILKWGMAGWHSQLSDSWENNLGDDAIGNSSWVAPPGNLTPPSFFTEQPDIQSGYDEGAYILSERVEMLLEDGFKGIANSDVLISPQDYFVNVYLTLQDVEYYGHISDAYILFPFTLSNESYKNLDASAPIVSYCWTGQTTAMLTSYLRILGYDASVLKFGINGMIYSNLVSHKYTSPIVDYPLVPSK